MAQQGVRDLVAHHHRHRVGVLRHRHQAGIDRDLAARQAERVDLVGLQHVDVPVEGLLHVRRLQVVFGGERILDLRDLRDQPLRDLAHLARDLRVGIQRLLLRQDLLVGLQAQRLFVLRGDALVDHHLLAGQRIGAAVGEPVERGVTGEQHQHPQAQAAESESAARALAAWLPNGSCLICPLPVE